MKSVNSTNIVRVEKSKNYTVINNTCLRDDRLSWKAKGIMCYFLQLPDNWIINLEEIITHSPDGEKAFRSGLKELKEFGYVLRKQVRGEGKKIIGWETIIYEVPQNLENTLLAQNLQVEKVEVENLHVENEGLLSTYDINYLNKINTNNNNNYSSVDKSTDINDVVEFYKTLNNLPQPREITTLRKKAINARINDYGLEEIKNSLEYFNQCNLVLSANEEKKNKKGGGWLTFDWIFNPNNMVKIVERKYTIGGYNNGWNERPNGKPSVKETFGVELEF